jgi:flagellar basal body rod protein FlgG
MISRISVGALLVVVLITGCRSHSINAPKAPPPTPVATEAAELIRACDRGDQLAKPSEAAIDLAIQITKTNVENAEITGFKRTCAVSDGAASRLQIDTEQGPIEQTGRDLDVSISGDGFFALETSAGIRYTRNGNFFEDAPGQMVSSDGHPLMPPVVMLPFETDVAICEDGTIVCGRRAVATLHLYRFAHPDRLMRDANGLLIPTAESGEPIEGSPADDEHKFGAILQSFLEGSNVDAGSERDRLQRLLATRKAQEESKQVVAKND